MPKHQQLTKENIAARRAAVSMCKLRYGWSTRKIAEYLATQPTLWNPETRKPWSQDTVKRDLTILTHEWREAAVQDTDAFRTAHLAELREARAGAWRKDDIASVLRALKQEADLLGLNAPQRIDSRHTGDVRLFQVPFKAESNEAWQQEAAKLNGQQHHSTP